MAPSSSCHIAGVFSLSEGSRNTDPSYYTTYLSALDFTDDEKFINVSIRKYTAPADILYADDSFVFMVAKAALPAGADGLLDSIYCTPFVPPPDGLQECLPPDPVHTAFITGTVTSTGYNSGSVRSFILTTSEYVRDERRTFTVRFKYDGTSSRWKNLRPPVTGSTVTAAGTFRDVSEDGNGEAVLNLLDISYGIPETVSGSPTRTVGHRRAVRASEAEPQGPSSSSTSQPPLEASGTTEGTAGKTTGKRSNEEEGQVEENVGKRLRTRKGKSKVAA